MRIIHGRRRAGLANETAPEFFIGGQRRRENLERYLPLESLIPGPEYDRHAALADLLFQAVPGNSRTGGEAGHEPAGGSGLAITHHPSRPRQQSA